MVHEPAAYQWLDTGHFRKKLPDSIERSEWKRLYDEDTVRIMLEGVWCAGYYHNGYTHDAAWADKMAEKCAEEFLEMNHERQKAA